MVFSVQEFSTAERSVCGEQGEQRFRSECLLIFLEFFSIFRSLASQTQHCLELETRFDQIQAVLAWMQAEKIHSLHKIGFFFLLARACVPVLPSHACAWGLRTLR